MPVTVGATRASTSIPEKVTDPRATSAGVPPAEIVPPFSVSAFAGTVIPSVSSSPATTS